MPNWRRRVIWDPPDDAWSVSRMGRFLDRVGRERALDLSTYDRAWHWSIEDLDGFWSEVAHEFDVQFSTPAVRVLDSRTMPGARWFEGSTLNYAREVLRGGAGEDVAVVGISQSRGSVSMTFDELRRDVARFAAGLRSLGVARGDRVAAYLPNCPEAIVAMFATVSIGAVWSSCAPEFGVRAVIDRFAQIEPSVLLAVTGYRYGTRTVDGSEDVAAIRRALSSVQETVVLPYLPDSTSCASATLPGARSWDELLDVEPAATLEFTEVPFEHPLYVLYSSGSTGLPKPIVHGHGGILLEHLKVLGLHHDLDARDTFLWFTTTGWMMWNFLISALALGTSIVTFDGDPSHPSSDELLRLSARVGVSVLGLGAPTLVRWAREKLPLPSDHDLSRLRQIGSTGAPLPPDGFAWVEQRFGRDVQLVSISGGTDVCTAFVGGAPIVPVHIGEISCRCLGAAVDAFDDRGRSVIGSLGEMVIRAPMPSMPVGFWGDEDASRYRTAYFEHFPGVWHHGDWIEITEDGSCIITGRSDATLNRGGIRSGTSEFMSIVESIAGVVDSLVVHLEDPDGGPGELILMVVLSPGMTLHDELSTRIRTALRAGISPRHVPDRMIAVPAIPRTISGKKVEVPVKRVLAGADPSAVLARDALQDPSAWSDLVEALRAAGLTRS